MATELKGRRVEMFRTHIDPMVGPKSKNAFHMKDFAQDTIFEITPIGVYVRYLHKVPGNQTASLHEHIVPYANIQSIKLVPLEEK